MNGIRLLCGFGHGVNFYGTKVMKFSQCGIKSSQLMTSRVYSQEARETVWRTSRARKQILAEAASKPPTAISIGQGAVAGASAFGLGALVYYGLGLSNQTGIIEQSMLWPQFVRDRVRTTYQYFGSSLAITIASAVLTSRTPILIRLFTKNSLTACGVTLLALMGTGLYTFSLEYAPTFNAKHVSWIIYSSLIGASLSPLALLGGAPVIRAMWYTAGVIGSLTAIAMCAPNDRFLYMGGPLAACLGMVFISSLGTLLVPASTALGSGLVSFTLYGGLILFSGFFLYDTQRIVYMAETHPQHGAKPFDPINASISIYMDTVNIFIRLVQIFGTAPGNRK